MIHSNLHFRNPLTFQERKLFQKFIDFIPYHHNRNIRFQEKDIETIINIYDEIKETQNIDFKIDSSDKRYFWKYLKQSIEDYAKIFPNEKMESHFLMVLYSRKIYDFNIEIKDSKELLIVEHKAELKDHDYVNSTLGVQLAYLKDLFFNQKLNDIYHQKYFEKNNVDGFAILPVNENYHNYDGLIINCVNTLSVKREKLNGKTTTLDWDFNYSKESFDSLSDNILEILLNRHQISKIKEQNQSSKKLKI